MVALGVGLFALLPRIGVLEADDMRRLNYMPVFFVAEAVSMGNVLEATKGLNVLTSGVFHWIEPLLTNIFSITAVLYWVAFVYHFLLASEISMLATSIPLVRNMPRRMALVRFSSGSFGRSPPGASYSPINPVF
jgi:hypothetical protein